MIENLAETHDIVRTPYICSTFTMGICCSCFRNPSSGTGSGDSPSGHGASSAPLLQQNERNAIAELLSFLENRNEVDFFTESPLKALSTLVYSNNTDLQRSAALAFAEITEKDVKPLPLDTFKPVLFLLKSNDTEVQRAACATLGNLAVNNENKLSIVQLGALPYLIKHMQSPNTEVKCNAVGCLTNLATHDDNKFKIAKSGALVPLTKLATNSDLRVQRNATGALLNMTHSFANRQEVVAAGAVPVLVSLLSTSSDPDVQYYCTTAISNIAVDEPSRKKLLKSEPKLVSHLIKLMDSDSPRIQCQATLALRNLASDPMYQIEIVRHGGLAHLANLLKSSHSALVLAAVACIRNISIHNYNEGLIVNAGVLPPLVALLGFDENEEIQCHTVSTLRNLASSSQTNREQLLKSNAIETCIHLCQKLINENSESATNNNNNNTNNHHLLLSELSALFAVLALSDDLKISLLNLQIISVLLPLTFAEDTEISGNSAAALANLCSHIPNYDVIIANWKSTTSDNNNGIEGFLIRFLNRDNSTFAHIALWTTLQLLESGNEQLLQLLRNDEQLVNCVKKLNLENKNVVKNNNTEENEESSAQEEIYNLTVQLLKYLV